MRCGAGFSVAPEEGVFVPLLACGQFTPEDILGPMKVIGCVG